MSGSSAYFNGKFLNSYFSGESNGCFCMLRKPPRTDFWPRSGESSSNCCFMVALASVWNWVVIASSERPAISGVMALQNSRNVIRASGWSLIRRMIELRDGLGSCYLLCRVQNVRMASASRKPFARGSRVLNVATELKSGSTSSSVFSCSTFT